MTASRRFTASLYVAQLVALATIVRSVLFERWVTVLASVLLIVGAQAAARSRAWGVGLALAMAGAFPAAHLLGMAPAWFWLVGVARSAHSSPTHSNPSARSTHSSPTHSNPSASTPHSSQCAVASTASTPASIASPPASTA